jgi:hypothetical protein
MPRINRRTFVKTVSTSVAIASMAAQTCHISFTTPAKAKA